MILEGDPEALNVIRRGIEADPNLNGVKIIAVPAALIEPTQLGTTVPRQENKK
jgi:hypothetical protein